MIDVRFFPVQKMSTSAIKAISDFHTFCGKKKQRIENSWNKTYCQHSFYLLKMLRICVNAFMSKMWDVGLSWKKHTLNKLLSFQSKLCLIGIYLCRRRHKIWIIKTFWNFLKNISSMLPQPLKYDTFEVFTHIHIFAASIHEHIVNNMFDICMYLHIFNIISSS